MGSLSGPLIFGNSHMARLSRMLTAAQTGLEPEPTQSQSSLPILPKCPSGQE